MDTLQIDYTPGPLRLVHKASGQQPQIARQFRQKLLNLRNLYDALCRIVGCTLKQSVSRYQRIVCADLSYTPRTNDCEKKTWWR